MYKRLPSSRRLLLSPALTHLFRFATLPLYHRVAGILGCQKSKGAESAPQLSQREAETIANLVHPHIVRVFDFDVSDGFPFLVMDYCPDGTLRKRHPKGERVPLPTVVSYVQQVAEALQYAHDQKIIHRDIKPENMLIGQRNALQLSDFGIAATAHSTSSMSTQAPVGTIPYMAPNRSRPRHVPPVINMRLVSSSTNGSVVRAPSKALTPKSSPST